MNKTITKKQLEEAQGRIFDNLASAISQTSQKNWSLVMTRVEEIRLVAAQLDGLEVED